MTPWLDDGDVRLYHGDCLEVLAQLPERSVDCCVTSPPYWGLRDYGTGRWEGGNPEHEHDTAPARGGRGGSGAPGKQTDGAFPSELAVDTCSCGATRVDRQLGLEQTPQEYVARMVEVFRGVRRVLKDEGTVWLNLGDSYANTPRGNNGDWSSSGLAGIGGSGRYEATLNAGTAHARDKTKIPGLKQKDLVGIPWRVAFALQDDGWYLRSDIIWAKPNPMPESVTDRPTKAHEYVFLLSKQPRYFFDQEAVREPHSREWFLESVGPGYMEPWQGRNDGGKRQGNGTPAGRNVRSVWEIATQPFPGAHFAVFPMELARRCVLAGSPLGGVVLDPFSGSGTTALVARNHQRHAIGIELNEDYLRIAADRLAQQSLLTGEAA